MTVRAGDWKLLRLFELGPNFPTDRELYNLRGDPSESKNVASANPAKVQELDGLIDAFIADTGALMPKPNPDYKPCPVVAAPQAPGPDDGTGVIAGWKLRQCKATTTNDGVRLEGSGKAPFLGTAKYQLAGAAEVRLRVRTPVGGMGQVHWRLSNEGDFDPESMVTFNLPPGDDWHDVTVAVPSDGPVVQLRLYLPADKGGRVECGGRALGGSETQERPVMAHKLFRKSTSCFC